MKQFMKKTKTIVFSVALAAAMLLPVGVSAQSNASRRGSLLGGGQFQSANKREGLFNTTNNRTAFDLTTLGMDNYGIGEEAPLGSGIALLLVAGLGYVALKKKED